MHENISARIGMVNFINTAPLYEVWKTTVKQSDWHVVEGNPVELNRKLSAGELDLGFISSHEYALSPEKYYILPGLSISAEGPVGSVYLFSECELQNLHDETVYFSPQSQTSNNLARVLLEKFIGVTPRYECSSSLLEPETKEKSVVAIGDRALRIRASGRYAVVVDLSALWQKYTGLPFVFAVWAVRRQFYHSNPDCVAAIHQELCRCVEQGKNNLSAICEIAAPKIPMSVEDCYSYLQGIEYDLGKDKIRALELFYTYLIEAQEVAAEALPLQFSGSAH